MDISLKPHPVRTYFEESAQVRGERAYGFSAVVPSRLSLFQGFRSSQGGKAYGRFLEASSRLSLLRTTS